MSLTTNEMSPADIAAVTRNTSCDDGMGWGGGGAWWIIILFLLASMGFGGFGGMFGGGWGGMMGGFGGGWGGLNGGGFLGAELQRGFDNQNIIRKLDEQTYGLADATYALNNTITGGFAQAELSRANQQAALMQQLCAMQSSMDKCCCETQRAIDGVNYNMAIQTNNLQNTMCNNTRDIVDNQNANARAILDALTAQRLADKDARIAEQQQTIFGLQLAASQTAQNAYLIGQLKQPCAVPSYIVPNPNAAYHYTVTQQGGCCNPCGQYG
jgi:hypothetical protein